MTIRALREIERLLVEQGAAVSNADIARATGANDELVRRRRVKLGIPSHVPRSPIPWASADWSQSVAQIAAALGCSRESVKQRRHRMGLSVPQRPWTAADDAYLLRFHAMGVTLRSIAADLGRTWLAVKERARIIGSRRRRGAA